jgi:hypothetical protein
MASKADHNQIQEWSQEIPKGIMGIVMDSYKQTGNTREFFVWCPYAIFENSEVKRLYRRFYVKQAPNTCDYCLESSEDLKTCSRCKNAYYCSKEHQTLHWKGGHKSECNSIPNSTSHIPGIG